MPHFKSGANTNGEDIVHMMNYQSVIGHWFTMCGEKLSFEDSDYVDFMPDARDTERPVNCMLCLVNEERWNEDGTLVRGREFV